MGADPSAPAGDAAPTPPGDCLPHDLGEAALPAHVTCAFGRVPPAEFDADAVAENVTRKRSRARVGLPPGSRVGHIVELIVQIEEVLVVVEEVGRHAQARTSSSVSRTRERAAHSPASPHFPPPSLNHGMFTRVPDPRSTLHAHGAQIAASQHGTSVWGASERISPAAPAAHGDVLDSGVGACVRRPPAQCARAGGRPPVPGLTRPADG
jgi:hypothetical protein